MDGPGEQQAGEVAKGKLSLRPGLHVEPVRAVDTLVLMLVAGVGAGQRAERHHSRHEARLRVRFAGPDQLVYLPGNGEAAPRRWWGFAERLAKAAQIGQGFPDRNQTALF